MTNHHFHDFRKILFALVISLPVLFANAVNNQTRVAIFDPVSSGPMVDEGTKVAVRELIGSSMVNVGNFSILERSLINKVMEEMRFTNSEAVDENQASELGKLAGANKVVLSVISRAGKRNMLSIKIIDVETATIERQKAKVVKPDALLDEVEPMVAEMLGKGLSNSQATLAKQNDNASGQTIEKNPENPLKKSRFPGIPLQSTVKPNEMGGVYYASSNGEFKAIDKTQSLGSGINFKQHFLGGNVFEAEYPDQYSDYQIHDQKPDFYILLGQYADIANIKFVKLNSKKDTRKLKIIDAVKLGGVLYDKSQEINTLEKGDGVYVITPKKNLKKGSYAIFYSPRNTTPPDLYTFDIQ